MATLRVLLAESDSAFCVSAENALARHGYSVVPALTSQDALQLVAGDEIDVIVLDLELDSNSLEIVAAARAHSPPLPVILLASSRSLEVAAAGVRQGAFDYVLKPIDDFSRLAGLIARAEQPTAGQTTTSPDVAPSNPRPGSEAIGSLLISTAAKGQALTALDDLFAKEFADLADAPRVLVLLLREPAELDLVAWAGFARREEAEPFFVEIGGEDFAWRVIEARQPVWQSTELAGSQAILGQELLGLPLTIGARALGAVISISRSRRQDVPPGTLDSIRHLTNQFSLLVELDRMRELARRLAPLDPVTGLYTRSHFFELADREFRRSWRFAEPIAALEVDIDDFGRIQSLFGNQNGDQVIQQISLAVAPRLRSIDLIGRIDEDRFGVLVLKGTRETATAIAERIRRAIAEIELSAPDGPWQVTASVGVATYPRETCASVHDLFALASEATRIAKRAGRNRVVGV